MNLVRTKWDDSVERIYDVRTRIEDEEEIIEFLTHNGSGWVYENADNYEPLKFD